MTGVRGWAMNCLRSPEDVADLTRVLQHVAVADMVVAHRRVDDHVVGGVDGHAPAVAYNQHIQGGLQKNKAWACIYNGEYSTFQTAKVESVDSTV
jgi:hypothetical protein